VQLKTMCTKTHNNHKNLTNLLNYKTQHQVIKY